MCSKSRRHNELIVFRSQRTDTQFPLLAGPEQTSIASRSRSAMIPRRVPMPVAKAPKLPSKLACMPKAAQIPKRWRAIDAAFGTMEATASR